MKTTRSFAAVVKRSCRHAALAVLVSVLLIVVLAAPPSGRIELTWDYPTNELSADLSFRVYSTTNISLALTNWPCLTNFPGTQTSGIIQITPGQQYFVMTASNFWGESSFSNVTNTPVLARTINMRGISRKEQ